MMTPDDDNKEETPNGLSVVIGLNQPFIRKSVWMAGDDQAHNHFWSCGEMREVS